jgi:hypothetical protein
VNARAGEAMMLGAESAFCIHEGAAESGALGELQISLCDSRGSAEGIAKGPNLLPEKFLNERSGSTSIKWRNSRMPTPGTEGSAAQSILVTLPTGAFGR